MKRSRNEIRLFASSHTARHHSSIASRNQGKLLSDIHERFAASFFRLSSGKTLRLRLRTTCCSYDIFHRSVAYSQTWTRFNRDTSYARNFHAVDVIGVTPKRRALNEQIPEPAFRYRTQGAFVIDLVIVNFYKPDLHRFMNHEFVLSL